MGGNYNKARKADFQKFIDDIRQTNDSSFKRIEKYLLLRPDLNEIVTRLKVLKNIKPKNINEKDLKTRKKEKLNEDN